MNELGQMLRESRESQGISLAEAEASTRIRQKFIAAMEAEEWSLLPNEVTTRGFLRKYAGFLGLDVDAALQAFQSRTKTPGPSPVAAVPLERDVDYRPIEMDLAPPPQRSIPWGWIGAAVILLALAGAALYIYFYQPNFVSNLLSLPRTLPNPANLVALEPTATPTATMQVNRVTATPSATPEMTATWTPAPAEPVQSDQATEPATAAAVAAATPTSTTPAFSPLQVLTVRMNVAARSWVRVVVDNRLALESVLEAGEERSWEATDSIVLRTGNAAGILLTLNSQPLPPLGGPGEVVELQWRLVDGQIVQTTPVPTPSGPEVPPAPEDTPTPETPGDG